MKEKRDRIDVKEEKSSPNGAQFPRRVFGLFPNDSTSNSARLNRRRSMEKSAAAGREISEQLTGRVSRDEHGRRTEVPCRLGRLKREKTCKWLDEKGRSDRRKRASDERQNRPARRGRKEMINGWRYQRSRGGKHGLDKRAWTAWKGKDGDASGRCTACCDPVSLISFCCLPTSNSSRRLRKFSSNFSACYSPRNAIEA